MTEFIKFIHLILVLGLVGTTFYCLIAVGSKKNAAVLVCSRIILYLSLLALITGTLLVYPKHYTFHTPWIQAAYLLILVFALSITLIKRKLSRTPFVTHNRGLYRMSYLILIGLLVIVIHDAVTKTTFI